ncbi:hypothetical protein [Ileibacterium valens]|uniref:hypothetical protein n=1 Tax=Ileibacterium valens TaxID=1862668 RepID=UPI00259BA4A7|nr:hypothetical protein [Ileibacterium valens]
MSPTRLVNSLWFLWNLWILCQHACWNRIKGKMNACGALDRIHLACLEESESGRQKADGGTDYDSRILSGVEK